MLKRLRLADPEIRKNIPLLTVEILSIFFSVLLAFSLDQWRDAREVRRTAELALSNIEREVQRNRETVATILEIHNERLPRIAELQGSVTTEKTAFEWYLEVLNGENPRMPLLERSAWEAAVAISTISDTTMESSQP